MYRHSSLLAALLFVVGFGAAQEFPASVQVKTGHLVFHTAADLSPLMKQAGTSRIVKLRAFVADVERAGGIEENVRQAFRKRRWPLPALTVVVVGALPGGAVAWESVAESPQAINPHGLAFIQGQPDAAPKPGSPMAPLTTNVLNNLRTCVTASQTQPADVLRVDVPHVRSRRPGSRAPVVGEGVQQRRVQLRAARAQTHPHRDRV